MKAAVVTQLYISSAHQNDAKITNKTTSFSDGTTLPKDFIDLQKHMAITNLS
jgi:hypothetical protein